MTRIPILLLSTAILACPATALAARLVDMSPPPPMGTTIDGFNQVMGPAATEPEHQGEFVNSPFAPCPPCSQPARRPDASQGEPTRH